MLKDFRKWQVYNHTIHCYMMYFNSACISKEEVDHHIKVYFEIVKRNAKELSNGNK